MKFHPLVPDHEVRKELSPFRYFGSTLVNIYNIALINEYTRNGKPYIVVHFLAPDLRDGQLLTIEITDDKGIRDYETWIHEQGLCRECQRSDGSDTD